ncbi:hypothetical protein AWC06_03490 [Mycobacterium fragae]|uniref:Uncharacterized protein n=2 Tax=Mycobacterium fragae TaxID=1260918 RepID=A0A1X1UHP4_9MYCO|nr:hypothetical protein AWC06_03490 [Mycobacterium fragae]
MQNYFKFSKPSGADRGGAMVLLQQPIASSATNYSIVEDEQGPAHPRISAVNASGVEIAGAFQPPDRPYWLLYVTPLLANTAGIEFRHDPVPLGGREEARQWVNLVAQLYVKAAS